MAIRDIYSDDTFSGLVFIDWNCADEVLLKTFKKILQENRMNNIGKNKHPYSTANLRS